MPDGRILLVEDDPSVSSALQRRLLFEGYQVSLCTNGEEAIRLFVEQEFELVLLDLMLPGIGGIEASRLIRKSSDVPILMLTALGSLQHRVAGFESGADDYLVKPFQIEELLVRIRALLRRYRKTEERDEVLKFGDLTMNVAIREVTRDSQKIELTPREFSILEYFLRNPRRVLTREQIYAAVWETDYMGNANIIDVNIKTLRAKLETHKKSRVIRTARGVGYCLRTD